MLATTSIDSEFFSLSAKPNRSLNESGRMLWLCLIACTTLLVAGAGVALGAWMVLPFAGLEVALVWLAFCNIRKHDDDYEMLSVRGQNFKWELRCGSQTSSLEGNRHWAHVSAMSVSGRQQLQLWYAGNVVVVGRLLPEDQHKLLAERLVQLFRNIE